ncbi:equilibrative nucleoside transporter 1-like isoform X2 [Homarus americanus]|uniref:equilibrative nucleoside transporter 1-like isoform X2 n=1 Tax=Homarus americanus TaxID=6706 RepID=UPI001C490E86|nr:equilibrative nucleoside transporter 1-like isoform X2 [Homarus americanus]
MPLKVTVSFYMLGIVTLLPWNFFITADSYWQYKFRNVSLEDEWDDLDAGLTPLQVSFMPTLIIVSNIFATLFLVVNSFIVTRVSERVRLLGSLCVSFSAMLLTTIFTFTNTDAWQVNFYIITMVIVSLLNIFMAMIQGSSYGLAGMFPINCINSMNSGQAIAGVFCSLARILSLVVGDKPLISGLVFFSIADVFLLASIADYIYLTKMEIYAKIKNKAENTESTQVAKSDWETYLVVFKKVWLMGTTYAGTLFVTLMIYPAVMVYVTSYMPESQWTKVYFQPTITFLVFNLGDLLGRETPRWIPWPGPEGWSLHILGAARLIFVPLLMLCHGDNKTFPTVFNHDSYYIILITLFAFTNGHVGTLTLIYYPGLLKSEELEVGGAIMAAMLGVGMVVGSLLSPGFVALWGPK